MKGLDLDLPVVKRRSGSVEELHEELTDSGFEATHTALGGRVHFHENENGVGFTLVDGPVGSWMIPSGPLRGSIFGENSVGLSRSTDKKEEAESGPSDGSSSGRTDSDSGSRYQV